MKLYVISWKDERWSADKKALKSLNELIASSDKNADLVSKYRDLDNLIKGFKDALLIEDSHIHTYHNMKKVWGREGAIILKR